MHTNPEHIVVLFDGVCNLCNGAVRFIIRRDKKDIFRFASIQSDAAKNILLQYDYKNNEMNSILVIDHEGLLRDSRAVLHICKHLGAPWKWLYGLRVIPRSWTDRLYRFVALNRYRWFGKRKHCTTSMDKYENRFILATDEPILE